MFGLELWGKWLFRAIYFCDWCTGVCYGRLVLLWHIPHELIQQYVVLEKSTKQANFDLFMNYWASFKDHFIEYPWTYIWSCDTFRDLYYPRFLNLHNFTTLKPISIIKSTSLISSTDWPRNSVSLDSHRGGRRRRTVSSSSSWVPRAGDAFSVLTTFEWPSQCYIL